MASEPPPRPPPHGQNPRPPGGGQGGCGLPDGNYDIFIIPPHSSGSGFLYLPSLKPQRNSFIAGVASTLVCVYIWSLVAPVLKAWLRTVVQSGAHLGMLISIVGALVGGWAWGKVQNGGFNATPPPTGAAGEKAQGDGPGAARPGAGPGGASGHNGHNGSANGGRESSVYIRDCVQNMYAGR